jgi:hypothetical protein
MKEAIDNLISELDALRGRYTNSNESEAEHAKKVFEQFANVRDAYESLNECMIEYEN